MTERDYLWCALNMMLDEEEVLERMCPSCRSEAVQDRCPVCGQPAGERRTGENLSFDWERFEALRRGERSEAGERGSDPA